MGAAALLIAGAAGASETAVAPGADPAAGDAERGRLLAERWCVECHVVSPGTPGGDLAPSFASVANREGGEAEIVRAWLVDPHPPMPNMSLTMAEIDDLVAYVMSLRD